MSDLSSTKLQILLNGEKHEPLPNEDQTEEHVPSVSLEGGDKEESDNEAQVKMQSILQQVRKQIRSQGAARTPKNNILALVQKVWEREVETTQGNADAEKDNSEEERQEETGNQKEEDLSAAFEEKLETCKKALKEEFEIQILQLRNEMQAYTDQAIKELKSKKLSGKDVSSNPKEQPKQGPDKKQPPSTAPVALRRGRLLTRTMTTIIPKTCTPVIIGPRAKSETLTSSNARLGRDNTLTAAAKTYQCRRPLPPAGPRQPKRQIQAKTGPKQENESHLGQRQVVCG